MIRVLYFVAIIATFGFVGCNKNERIDELIPDSGLNNEIVKQTNVIEYSVDGVVLDSKFAEKAFDPDRYNIVYVCTPEGMKGYALSNEEQLIDFGKKHGVDMKPQLEYEAKMRAFAESSGIIDAYELHEKTRAGKEFILPQEWYDYDYNLRASLGLPVNSPKALFVTLYKGFYNTGSTWVMSVRTAPFMAPTWNDAVRSIEFVGVGGYLVVYDKTFFRKKLATYYNWGLTAINFPSGVDKRMSSGIFF